MNQKVVLEWLKANVFSVILLVLTAAALVILPLIARGLTADVRAEVEQRGRYFDELSQLEQTQVEVAGADGTVETHTVIVNQRLLDRYREYVEQQREDAHDVYRAALEHNQKGRDVLMPELFPEPPAARREVLPERFHEQLMQAYVNLLASVGAGAPPPVEDVREALQRREFQYRTQVLQRDPEETLPSEERRELQQQLTSYRLIRYQEAAERITFYMTKDALDLPQFDHQPIDELFEWQWRFWVHTDLLHAFYRANEGDPVLRGPVKRVERIAMSDRPGVRQDDRGGDRGSGRGGGSAPGLAGMGGRGGPGAAPPAVDGPDEVGAQHGQPVDPTAEVPIDYTHSLTGRKTNPLYDVKYVRLDLVLDSRRIPEVIDALATENFMTVLDVRISPVNPYTDARSGYLYGSGPVSRVSMVVETIWLREWTGQFMPPEMRSRLGILLDDEGSG